MFILPRIPANLSSKSDPVSYFDLELAVVMDAVRSPASRTLHGNVPSRLLCGQVTDPSLALRDFDGLEGHVRSVHSRTTDESGIASRRRGPVAPYSVLPDEIMEMSVLWSPEMGRCSQCGIVQAHVRRYTMGGCATVFCHSCWNEFIHECNVAPGPWQMNVSASWRQNVSLCLEFEDERGTAQRAACWN